MGWGVYPTVGQLPGADLDWSDFRLPLIPVWFRVSFTLSSGLSAIPVGYLVMALPKILLARLDSGLPSQQTADVQHHPVTDLQSPVSRR